MSAVVVLVDNDSGDDSVERIRTWSNDNDREKIVHLVQAGRNAGFAGGNNIGISAVDADYYLLLNSDTLVRPKAIAKLLDTARQQQKAGIISPRLEWPDGMGQESCFRFHSPISEFLGAAKTGPLDKWLASYVVPMPVQTQRIAPDWTSFACVLIRREVFREVGLLDEGYFMYYEDVEFCRRARSMGWEIIHDPNSKVVHLRGGSSNVKKNSRLKKRLPRYFYESRTRYFHQAYGWLGLTVANLLSWSGRTISGIRQILGQSDMAATEREWLDIWTNWIDPSKSYTHPNGD